MEATRHAILFVDDDTRSRDGMRRMLRRAGDSWDVRFAASGPEALAMLDREPADIVLTELRLGGVSGLALLDRVRAEHPETARVILSGYSERETILQSVGRAHRFLAKPVEPDVLQDTIRRILALRDVLARPGLRDLVSGVERLPSLPRLYQEILQTLERPNVNLAEIAQIVSRDIGVTAEILKVVNSAFFGLSRPIHGIDRAVTYLGVETIKALVLAVELFSEFDESRIRGFSLNAVFEHSARTANCARIVARLEGLDGDAPDDAFVSGMLHEVGRLILAAERAVDYDRVMERVGRDAAPVEAVERDVFGADHGEVGAYLLGLWGLPAEVVEAVALCSRPSSCPVTEFGTLAAVHAGHAVALSLARDSGGRPPAEFDDGWLERIGRGGSWPAWQAACRDC